MFDGLEIRNIQLYYFFVLRFDQLYDIITKEGVWNYMEKIKVDRINELARLSKSRALNDEEKREQAALREEYINEVRRTLRPELFKEEK